MTEEQKRRLESQLWAIANTLRGKMDADEFRDYILGFIFYKYLSEKMYIFANKELKEDGIVYHDIDENSADGKTYLAAVKEASVQSLGYFLKPSELFSDIAKRGNVGDGDGKNKFILDDLTRILGNIENSTMGTESEDDFDKLFEDLDLNSTKLGRTTEARNEVIAKVLAHLDKIDFELEKVESDVLGDAYEYLIGQFASGAGKKAGEFYTPQEVSKILSKLVTTGKTKLQTVYDPTCGSGSLLLRVAREVKEVGSFHGQELNRTTYNLCRMNMILHGVHYRNFDIKQEDTLERPQHIDDRFEAIVANPPFSAQWSANPLHMSDDRFSQYGKLAPSSKADFAFIQHMIHHLAENGQMAVVMPHGVLFRGGAEGHIRRYLIEDRNYLDAVIGLPENIFFGTDIATCILVFKKCRENSENVLFIDASKCFQESRNKSQLFMGDENVFKIVNAYRERKDIKEFSCVVPVLDIKYYHFDLNIPRYIDTSKIEESINLYELARGSEKLSLALRDLDLRYKELCKIYDVQFIDSYNVPIMEEYRANILRLLFSQEIRLVADKKNVKSWKSQKLKVVLKERKERNTNNEYKEVFSVAKEKGVINQVEHLGRSYASEDLSTYKIVHPWDVVYTKSPTSDFPYGIVKQNKLSRIGVVSVLYAVFTPSTMEIGRIIDYYFSSSIKTYNYLNPLVHKGAKNTMNINNQDFLNGKEIMLPEDVTEQKNIIEFMDLVDRRISLIKDR